jgi:hypothetical protein
MINAKIAEHVRCTLEKTVGHALWSKDLVDKVIWKTIAEKHLLIAEKDVDVIAKMVIGNKCGDVFVEPETDVEEEDEYVEEPYLDLINFVCDDLVSYEDWSDFEYLERDIADLQRFYDARDEYPSQVEDAIYNLYTTLKVMKIKYAEIDELWCNLNECIEELRAEVENLES